MGIPIEVVFVLAQHFRDKNMPDHALIVETSADLCLRQGEWEQLRASDIYDDHDRLAFVLGVAERSERGRFTCPS